MTYKLILRIGLLASAAFLPVVWLPAQPLTGDAVRLWEAPVTLPTYRAFEPYPHPMFLQERAYQSIEGNIYPNPLSDRLSDERAERSYKGVFLENEFLSVLVLPEIGGRLHAAVDKTNGYDFFYRQSVIKPALIGLLGPWISGGIEWNFPQLHRATAYQPIDYWTVENPDGSKTVWVGEVEPMFRMKWMVGLTLYPGRAYLETTIRLFNRTPHVQPFMWWANAATHANDDYQIIFPPDVEFVAYHAKSDLMRFPVADGEFRGVDYTGVDISWYRNLPVPISYFAWESAGSFFGGYDHGRKAGTLQVAEAHVSPGKKLWSWGTGPSGQLWERILTETDGPYVELMAGAFSDNQPDFSWLQPFETKVARQYWYPIQQIGYVREANLDAALNLENREDKLFIGVHTTRGFDDASIQLLSASEALWQETANLAPGRPFTREISTPEGFSKDAPILRVVDSRGVEIIRYRPSERGRQPPPKAFQPPPPPAEVSTVEELYLTGLHIEQFRQPVLEPEPYYEEALSRDSENASVHNALGLLALKRGQLETAADHFGRAIARLTMLNPNPREGEASFNLGVTRRLLGQEAEAYDAFYKATWSQAWRAPAFFALAQLAARRGEIEQALGFADLSLLQDGENTSARTLRATLLRRLGRVDEAEEAARKALQLDPLDYWARNELALIRSERQDPESAQILDRLKELMMDPVQPQSYLDLSLDYARAGFYPEALDVLSRAVDSAVQPDQVYPMIYYYLGYFHDRQGDPDGAGRYYQLGRLASPDYCFPSRLESIEVLNHVRTRQPDDPRASYYLGNLFYDKKQYEKAIALWEQARELDSSFAPVHRNLALAYHDVRRDVRQAIDSQAKAFELNRSDSRFLLELDRLHKEAGIESEARLALLESHPEQVAERDDLLAENIALLILAGRPEDALDRMEGRVFHPWEGGRINIHQQYEWAHRLLGERYLNAGDHQRALKEFESARQYPENLRVARPRSPREAPLLYLSGLALKGLDRLEEARMAFEQAAAEDASGTEADFYRGLALRELGRRSEADAVFTGLMRAGRSVLSSEPRESYFAKFDEDQVRRSRQATGYFLLGLGLLGEEDLPQARQAFLRTLEMDPYHPGAHYHLSRK